MQLKTKRIDRDSEGGGGGDKEGEGRGNDDNLKKKNYTVRSKRNPDLLGSQPQLKSSSLVANKSEHTVLLPGKIKL